MGAFQRAIGLGGRASHHDSDYIESSSVEVRGQDKVVLGAKLIDGLEITIARPRPKAAA